MCHHSQLAWQQTQYLQNKAIHKPNRLLGKLQVAKEAGGSGQIIAEIPRILAIPEVHKWRSWAKKPPHGLLFNVGIRGLHSANETSAGELSTFLWPKLAPTN